MKADTTDALLERKKQMHMATFNYNINEIANLLQARSKLKRTTVCCCKQNEHSLFRFMSNF